jgi:hypothetical protein|tara:strand:- start:18293 stop:18628 length:336 start_codon:yes stop_codon:yes gene_type:complete
MSFTVFEAGGDSLKAHHHLKNLKYIESHGLNLNVIFSDLSHGVMPSITSCEKILFHALWADIDSREDRQKFVKNFFEQNGAFKASDRILTFVLEALRMPKQEESEDVEKKS